ncbi:unnamed protein product [Trichogramma brassicae]|uniref:Nudix hydrolase domain-containing protein n=1 Tax=Trichogramma brassicae TaxID=86971 RepID=A0A6H5I8R5_9HYME|nr:unnamed protein product [Trichogramma brassicae]
MKKKMFGLGDKRRKEMPELGGKRRKETSEEDEDKSIPDEEEEDEMKEEEEEEEKEKEEEEDQDHPLVVSDLGNVQMYERILDVRNVRLETIDESDWYDPMDIEYQKHVLYEMAEVAATPDEFQYIVWDSARQELLFVRRFRPASYVVSLPDSVYLSKEPIDTDVHSPYGGIAIEPSSCKHLDKERPWFEHCRQQLRKDFGYEVPNQFMVPAQTVNEAAPPNVTSKRVQYIYSEVNDGMKLSEEQLAALGSPMHQVVRMTIDQAVEFAESRHVPGPVSTLFAIRWFVYHKKAHFDELILMQNTMFDLSENHKMSYSSSRNKSRKSSSRGILSFTLRLDQCSTNKYIDCAPETSTRKVK